MLTIFKGSYNDFTWKTQVAINLEEVSEAIYNSGEESETIVIMKNGNKYRLEIGLNKFLKMHREALGIFDYQDHEVPF